jgi:hypothetical protein
MTCPIGSRHSFWSAGIDIVRGRLVRVRRCSFCGFTKHLPYKPLPWHA